MKKKTKLIKYIPLLLLLSVTSCNGVGDTSSMGSVTSIFSSSSIIVSSEESKDEQAVYFDSNYSTEGDGTKDKPFNDIELLNHIDFNLFKKVYFKAGSMFNSQLSIKNLNNGDDYLFSSYGDGEKPKFNGNGLEGSGVLYIENCSNLKISNLEFYDSCNDEGDRRGAFLISNSLNNEEVTTYDNVTLENLYIHNINGFKDAENSGMAYSSKKTGGIVFGSTDGKGRFNNLTIKDCKIQSVDNVGICSYYYMQETTAKKVSPYSAEFKNYAHTNVNIEGNDISDIGKNAIFLRNAKDSFIQRNVVHDSAVRCVSGNSIVTSYVDNVIVQYNEGYNNKARYKDANTIQDGCMLDADLQSKDTIWQYNYSHDNSFGLFLNCTSYNEEQGVKDKAIVRYNLSINDKGNKGIVYVNYVSDGIDIYNNTFVTSNETQTILQANKNTKFKYYNNAIYNRSAKAKFNILGDYILSNNLVYSVEGASIENLNSFKQNNANGIYTNPLFTGPIDEAARTNRDEMSEYTLSSDSPCIGTGLPNDGELDYFSISATNNIGCSSNK